MNLVMKSFTAIYGALLYLYPVSVRREDGGAMMQTFRDVSR